MTDFVERLDSESEHALLKVVVAIPCRRSPLDLGRHDVAIAATRKEVRFSIAQANALPSLPAQVEVTPAKEMSRVLASRKKSASPLRLIPFRRAGTQRRVLRTDLPAFRRRADADRRAVLAELAAYDQELGI